MVNKYLEIIGQKSKSKPHNRKEDDKGEHNYEVYEMLYSINLSQLKINYNN